MPRNTREWAQRELDSAVGNLDWAGKHLISFSETYKEHHPELAVPATEIALCIIEIQNSITRLKATF